MDPIVSLDCHDLPSRTPGHGLPEGGTGAARHARWSRLEPADARTVDRALLRLEGEYWTMIYVGRTLRLRDAVGLRHLAQLLWHPQREFHALDLMRALALAGGSRGGRLPRSDAPALDAHAAAAYRRRVRE